MEIIQLILPFIGWVIAGAVVVSLGGIFASVHNTRLKIKNGYPIEGMWGQSLKPEMTTEAMERVKLVTQENAALRAELSSMKDRLAVVERIVTDKGFDVAHQIEQLRADGQPAPQGEAKYGSDRSLRKMS